MTEAIKGLPQIRRVLYAADHRIDTQIASEAGWLDAADATWPEDLRTLPTAFTPAFEIARYQQLGLVEGATVLPVCPASFRDFMVYEKHAVDAARGLAKRFVPKGYRVARIYETVTRRTFPLFRPNALWYREPIYYMSNALTFVPSGVPIHTPSYSRALDFELELGVVLGSPLRDATVEQAAAAIAAVVVVNDFSARDVQLAEMRSGFGPQKAKHFISSMSATAVVGSALAPHLDGLAASVAINGKTVSRTTTAGMRYSVAEAIAHASRGEQLFPGELLSTGTLPGGSGMELGCWLAPGDELRLEIDAVGVIEHRVQGPEVMPR